MTIIRLIKNIGKFIIFDVIPDSLYVKWRYKQKTGQSLNLREPKTLNEKIQWLKIYDRTDIHTICADKVKVRDYVKERIGDKYLVPLIYNSSDLGKLTIDKFPDYPSILKSNHDSGTHFIVQNKLDFDLVEAKSVLQRKLNQNYYRTSKEWQYKNIQPQYLIEKLLIDNNGNIPFDYKVHCFNGNPRMIQVDIGRGTVDHKRNWYNIDWQREPYYWASVKDGKETVPADYEVDKPLQLDLMLNLSKKLASDFKYVRIDWYDCNNHLFFGEITFHHDSGYRPVNPLEWDYKLGDLIKIN